MKTVKNCVAYILLMSVLLLLSCISQEDNTVYDVPVQKMDLRDSLLFSYTGHAWMDSNFYLYGGYRANNDLESTEVIVYRVFYDKTKTKFLCWLMYKNNRNKDGKIDISHTITGLIGFRTETNKIWSIYPLDNQTITSSDNPLDAVVIIERYYFKQMKDHEMSKIIQSGDKTGQFELKAYEYNIQDEGFWEKCWIWEKDTVGANGLYPFQIYRYDTNIDTCFKCAIPYKIPKVVYPQELIKMYE